MINLFRNLLLFVGLIIVFVSCEKDIGPFIISNEIEVDDPQEFGGVSFKDSIQPIFDAHCISCHNNINPQLNLQSNVAYSQLLSSGYSAPYVDTLAPQQSKLFLHINGELSFMPPSGPLSELEKQLILKWIEEGANDN